MSVNTQKNGKHFRYDKPFTRILIRYAFVHTILHNKPGYNPTKVNGYMAISRTCFHSTLSWMLKAARLYMNKLDVL
jgi:hypothetical protein